MNAPAVIERPADQASPPALPFNLQPYAEGEFEKMHAAGSMLASASSVPSLFNKIPQRYGKLCYARHLKGDKPLPDLDDIALIKIGNLLEPLAAELLSKELGVDVVRFEAYSRHPWLPLFATPDAVAWIDDIPHIVEIKTVSPRVWSEHWQDGPPIHVELQHQTQFACTGAQAGFIASLSPAYGSLDFWPTHPHRAAIECIELGVDSFMATLERGDMPDPDDTEVDFEAFRDICWKSEPEKTVKIHGDEALLRMRQFAQSKLDETAADKTIAANKRWFQGLMKDAETAELDDGSVFTWKTNKTAGKSHRPARVFKLKESNGDDNG